NSLNILGLTLSLIANTNLGNTSESGSGFIDPILTIDPAFARAAEFSLVFSDGVGNTLAATPIPAALPLFGTGVGLVGFVGWWRKKRGAAAAAQAPATAAALATDAHHAGRMPRQMRLASGRRLSTCLLADGTGQSCSQWMV